MDLAVKETDYSPAISSSGSSTSSSKKLGDGQPSASSGRPANEISSWSRPTHIEKAGYSFSRVLQVLGFYEVRSG
jgi:hypothetical protein